MAPAKFPKETNSNTFVSHVVTSNALAMPARDASNHLGVAQPSQNVYKSGLVRIRFLVKSPPWLEDGGISQPKAPDSVFDQ